MSEQKAPASQHLPAVIAVLAAQAYGSDDEPQYQWEMYVNPVVWRITAATADTFAEATSAQAGANALVESLVAASQARLRVVQQGAVRGFGSDAYRGALEVALEADEPS